MGKKGKKTQKPPAVDKLLMPAIGVAAAVLGYYFFQGVSLEIPRIDPTDELALREVFFGEGRGKNYAVLCNTLPADESKKPLPISSVFSDAAEDGSANADFVLLDCEHVLPDSGKTVAERFGINLKKRPTVFVSGKVGPPKQVPEKHLKTGNMLVKLLRQMLEPHAQKIENTKDLKVKCLNRDRCGLLLKGGKPEPYVKEAISNLLKKHPDVTFASVDSTVLLLSNLEEYLPEFVKGQHRFVVFEKVSGGLDVGGKDENETEDGGAKKEKESRLVTSILPLNEGVSFNAMDRLVVGSKQGKAMKKIPALPNVKTRTKKLEEAERKKRQRYQDRQRQQSSSSSSSSHQSGGGPTGGAFTANDGSKEGRRLERERRRAEHMKQNDVKPKTPEEIAEMERRRRQRMAEEEAKWNIGAEDAPPEGDPVDEEEGGGDGEADYMDMDDGEEWADEDGDGGDDEDDEDVIDLD